MLAPDPPMYLLLPLYLWAAVVEQCFVLELGVGRASSMYSTIHREHNYEKNVLVALFRGTLLLAPPAASAAAVECLGTQAVFCTRVGSRS